MDVLGGPVLLVVRRKSVDPFVAGSFLRPLPRLLATSRDHILAGPVSRAGYCQPPRRHPALRSGSGLRVVVAQRRGGDLRSRFCSLGIVGAVFARLLRFPFPQHRLRQARHRCALLGSIVTWCRLSAKFAPGRSLDAFGNGGGLGRGGTEPRPCGMGSGGSTASATCSFYR